MAEGTALKARPTTYKGIEMRSRLEGKYAQWLDRVGGNEWIYEPKCFADETGQYLPDFLVRGVQFFEWTVDVYVEVKPLREMFPFEVALQKARIIWSSEPESIFVSECADRVWLTAFVRGDSQLTCCWSTSSITGGLILAPALDREWRGA